ncbi:hypothetical protein [Azospirillum halopraeferens]|uniref:hypothetical protein n=1 Tax=Azospirillum halopraeferens TaxID=34010 RepID=UPI00048ED217|nr:hypothetical protein [Azospirillum halopraeferens]
MVEACANAGFAMLTAGLRYPARSEHEEQPRAVRGCQGDMQVARNMATGAAAARDEAIVTDTTRQPTVPVAPGWSAAVAKLKK